MPKIILKNKSATANARVRLIENADSSINIGGEVGAVAKYDGVVDICLAPKAIEISCEGSLNRTPIMEITGPGEFAIGDAGEYASYTTPEELVTALEQAGLVVEIVPPEPFESTEIFLSNTRFAPDLPLDGTKTYVMDASITRNGIETPLPISHVLTNPPFSRPDMDFNLMVFMMWLTMSLRVNHPDILTFFKSKMFENDPSIMTMEKVNLSGNLENDVDEVDVIKLTFLPSVDLPPDAVDFYDTIFGTDYPHGVIVKTYGKILGSNVYWSTLSQDNKTLAYTAAIIDQPDGVRIFNPDMTYTELDTVSPYFGNSSISTDEPTVSDDGKLIVNSISLNNGTHQPPLFGYTIENDIITPITFNWGEHTVPNGFAQTKISPDNNLIIASNGQGEVVIAMKNLTNPNEYDVVKVAVGFALTGVSYVDYISETLLMGRSYFDGSAIRFTPIEMVTDYDARTVELTLLTPIDIDKTDSAIIINNSLVVPNGIISVVNGKVIYFNTSDHNAVTHNTLFEDTTIITENGTTPGVSLYLAKVGESDKLIYVRESMKSTITVYDIDLLTMTVSNPVAASAINDADYVGLFSRDPAIICAFKQGVIATEHLYKVNSDNTLSPITVPYTP